MSRMAIVLSNMDPRVDAMLGPSMSGFHRPEADITSKQARSAVTCSVRGDRDTRVPTKDKRWILYVETPEGAGGKDTCSAWREGDHVREVTILEDLKAVIAQENSNAVTKVGARGGCHSFHAHP